MFKKFIIWTLIGTFSALSWAQDLSVAPQKKTNAPVKSTSDTQSEKRVESILFNFGTHTEFYNEVQTTAGGETRKIDWKAPTLGVGLSIPLKYEWRFLPEFNWVLPRMETSRVIKNLFMYRADFGYDPLDWLRLRVGTSIMHLNQHGRGGKANVNNGDTTSTFYYPEENRSSLNNTLDFGIEGRYQSFALRLQTYIYSVFVEERRRVSYTLLFSYYWDR